MLPIIILIIGIFSRLVLHLPNFTPVIALALFGGVYIRKKYALLLPVTLMVVSDIFIGMHDTILFTWGSVMLIAAIGLWIKQRKTTRNVAGAAVFSAVLFFLITNFGAWLSLYPPTWSGLRDCYIAAIPFFRNTLLSTLVYSLVLFGLYESIAQRIRDTRIARILLTP